MIRAFQNFLDEMNIPSGFVDAERTMLEFTISDINYLYMYSAKDDPAYIRLMIPNVGAINEQSLQTMREIYNLTTSFKLGKAYIQNEQLWFVTEAFVYDRENLTPLFQRMLSVLRDMLNLFRTQNNG